MTASVPRHETICCTQYIIYLGVQEPTNSHVLVTVEGITEWQA